MNSRARILVVDDEPQIRRFLQPSITAAGHEVILAATGAEALRAIAAGAPDIVVLDLGLPDMDGKRVIEEVRRWSDIPIIVLSARDREAEKIAALDLGADDYLDKPFGMGELLARVRAGLRRRASDSNTRTVYTSGNLTVDVGAHRVMRGEDAMKLTPKEFDLLVCLVRNAGRVVTHRQILSTVWGPAHAGDTQYLRVFIGQLRHKLEEDPSEPRIVLTEPGVGYRLAEAD
jgi:two-component system, OmpR family, KDP operon response regulator KdpE